MENRDILIRIVPMLVFIAAVLFAGSAFAGWLIYHKPEFRGKVIDAETKEPIKGAVVVVIYKKHTLISGPGGGYTSVIKVKETLTGNNGEFYFPSYITLIQPNSIEDTAEFIVFKPMYWTFPGWAFPGGETVPPKGMSLPAIERFFSEGTIGKQGEIKLGDPPRVWKVIFGITGLPKLKTMEDKIKRMMGIPSEVDAKDLPLLYRAMDEEERTIKEMKKIRRLP